MPLIACPECDALQRETELPRGGRALCVRCGAVLYRAPGAGLGHTLALALAAAILCAIANLFPVVALEVRGSRVATTLFGTVEALYNQDRALVAALVFVTTIAAPALQIAALNYLLLPLAFGRVPRRVALVFRAIEAAKPWGMVEVFLLGVLVAIVKLAQLAEVLPGAALWALAALMLVLAAAAQSFEPRELWLRVAELRGGAP